MSIYQKLNAARADFHTLQLKKTGLNKFAGYSYFELGDFLIPAMRVFSAHGLCAYISFGADLATMTIVEIDGEGRSMSITSPMSSAALKGCHEVQNLGAVQTYLRRYLWVAALEIVEHDALDSSKPVEKTAAPKHSPLPEISIAADRVVILDDVAQAMRDHWNNDDISGAYEEYAGITDGDEKMALWKMLAADSKLRTAIKAFGISLKETV